MVMLCIPQPAPEGTKVKPERYFHDWVKLDPQIQDNGDATSACPERLKPANGD